MWFGYGLYWIRQWNFGIRKTGESFWTVEQLFSLRKFSSTWTCLCQYLGFLSSVISRNCWHAGRLTDRLTGWQTDSLTDRFQCEWQLWNEYKKTPRKSATAKMSLFGREVKNDTRSTNTLLLVILISNALSPSPNDMWLFLLCMMEGDGWCRELCWGTCPLIGWVD